MYPWKRSLTCSATRDAKCRRLACIGHRTISTVLRRTRTGEVHMPLSPPQERELLHSRDIVLRGYRRTDGLYDIEAKLTDSKSYGTANRDRNYIEAGAPIHGMWLRLTVDENRR